MMNRLRAHKPIVAVATAFAVLLSAVLGVAWPHSSAGAKATSHFDSVLGWVTICNNSGASSTAPSDHKPSDHDCCAAICAATSAALLTFATASPATRNLDGRTAEVVRFDPDDTALRWLQYGGRGSRAPPAQA